MRGSGNQASIFGRSLRDLGTAKQIAERMVATVPAPSEWDEVLGPVYSAAKLARLLGGVSRQAIADRRERRTILGLRTSDGAFVYPVFQFDADNQVLPGLPDVLQCFDPDHVDDWTLAGWLLSRQRALGGKSVIDRLRAGVDRDKAVALAQNQAERYAR